MLHESIVMNTFRLQTPPLPRYLIHQFINLIGFFFFKAGRVCVCVCVCELIDTDNNELFFVCLFCFTIELSI